MTTTNESAINSYAPPARAWSAEEAFRMLTDTVAEIIGIQYLNVLDQPDRYSWQQVESALAMFNQAQLEDFRRNVVDMALANWGLLLTDAQRQTLETPLPSQPIYGYCYELVGVLHILQELTKEEHLTSAMKKKPRTKSARQLKRSATDRELRKNMRGPSHKK